MLPILWSAEAEADLATILHYIAERSPLSAFHLFDDIERVVSQLPSHPRDGRPNGRNGERQNADDKYLIDIISPTSYIRFKEIIVAATAGAALAKSRKHTMIVEVQVTINGSKAAIWAAITNIENAAKTVSGIENIEVLEKPANGLVGLKWRETRMLFGKPASADKWITDAAENEFYKTRAESDGFVFLSTMSISEGDGGITLTSAHDSQPQSIVAKFMSIPMGVFFKGVAKKALL